MSTRLANGIVAFDLIQGNATIFLINIKAFVVLPTRVWSAFG